MVRQDRLLYILMLFLLAGILTAGLVADGPDASIRGLWTIQMYSARLVNDYSVVGAGAALVNASLVALIGLALVRLTGVRLSGPTVAAVFTLLGFGLFGKTPLNIAPILLGVWLAARLAGKQFRDYIIIALFGTALAPLVSLLLVEIGLPTAVGVPVALVGGLLAGMLLPSVAIVMLRMHQGYSLYNIGLTTGFLALFAAAVVFGYGDQLPGGQVWNANPPVVLVALVPVVCLVLAAAGLASAVGPAVEGFRRLLRQTGRLPSDFMDSEGVPASLLNMGVLGALMWVYTVAVGANLNGPVLGGLFTVIGFAAFGKHPRNVWPVLAGVVLAAIVFGKELSAPGVILAALFATTLAPLAGEFGPLVGVLAGFVHLAVVLRAGAWHAGIGLYNNGFAGGLTATLLVAVIEWFRGNRPERKVTRRGSYLAQEKENE